MQTGFLQLIFVGIFFGMAVIVVQIGKYWHCTGVLQNKCLILAGVCVIMGQERLFCIGDSYERHIIQEQTENTELSQ